MQDQHREILSKKRQLSRLNGAELPFVADHTSYVVPRNFTNSVYTFYAYRNIMRPELDNTSLLCQHDRLPENTIYSANGFVSYLTEDEWVLVNRLFGPTVPIIVTTRADQILTQIENKVAAVKERLMQQAPDLDSLHVHEANPSTSDATHDSKNPRQIFKEVKTVISEMSDEYGGASVQININHSTSQQLSDKTSIKPLLNGVVAHDGTKAVSSDKAINILSPSTHSAEQIPIKTDSSSTKVSEATLSDLVFFPPICLECVKEHSG